MKGKSLGVCVNGSEEEGVDEDDDEEEGEHINLGTYH